MMSLLGESEGDAKDLEASSDMDRDRQEADG